MKKFKRLAVLTACVAVLACSGCNTNSYTFYTNMPQECYELCDRGFKSGGLIGGYSANNPVFNDGDTSNYTTLGKTYFAMTADAQLVVSADFDNAEVKQKFDELTAKVMAVLSNVEKAVSSSVKDSDIYNFNNAQAGARLEVSLITYEVLSEAKAVYELTEGYYNPALYYNIFAYGFGGAGAYPQNSSELPDDEDIAKYTDLASHFKDLIISEEEGRYFVLKPEYTVEVNGEVLAMKLDFGGIGKGYAVDRVDELLDDYGFEYAYFNFSSSSMALKGNVSNGFYNIYISSPRSVQRDPYLVTQVRNEKLSTSGDDEQRYFIDGTRYCHIIDPTTGKPVQTGIMSATVIGGSACEDDALTTAIMAMGKDKAIQFIESKLADRRVVFTLDSYVS